MKFLILLSVLSMAFFTGSNSFAETWDTSCKNNDCFKNGWITTGDVNNFYLEAFCTNKDCLHYGWTSLDGFGTKISVTCVNADCFKSGWHSSEERINNDLFIDDAVCTNHDCLTDGWQVKSSYDNGGKVTCTKNNCSQIGGQSFWRSRRSTTKCKGHDCYHIGWNVHFQDAAVPPTY